MSTYWKALCAELTDALHDLTSLYEGHECELVTRSRAALAQPEPEGPTDEEIERFADDAGFVEGHAYDECGFRIHDEVGFARAVLARYARPAIEPVPNAGLPPRRGHVFRLAEIIREVDGNHDKGAAALAEAILSHPGSRWRPAIEPEPVSERLPGPEDCDEEGRCWWWCHHYESWQMDHAPAHYRHWLPHHALPVPQPSRFHH